MSQCVAVCCNVLQCVAVHCIFTQETYILGVPRIDSACCSMLQCFTMCCSVLQCVAVCCTFAQETCVLGEPRRALEKVDDDVGY